MKSLQRSMTQCVLWLVTRVLLCHVRTTLWWPHKNRKRKFYPPTRWSSNSFIVSMLFVSPERAINVLKVGFVQVGGREGLATMITSTFNSRMSKYTSTEEIRNIDHIKQRGRAAVESVTSELLLEVFAWTGTNTLKLAEDKNIKHKLVLFRV